MTLKLPQRLRILLVDESGAPIPEHDVLVAADFKTGGTVFHGQFLGVTDEFGELIAERGDILERYELEKQVYPMDIKGSLEGRDADVIFSIVSRERIDRLRNKPAYAIPLTPRAANLVRRARNAIVAPTQTTVVLSEPGVEQVAISLHTARVK